MADNEIKLKITIDGKEAVAALSLTDKELLNLAQSIRRVGNESRDAGDNIVHSFAQARNLIQGLEETFGILSQMFAPQLTAYQEQENALVKLNTALQQTNQLTDDNVKSLTDYAAQLQQTTIYGDEVTETVMAQLVAMGLSVEQTKQATLQAANLATVMGTDLNSAARAMADLFQGNTGMIGRYVKGLDETVIKSGDLNKIIAMLNERIGGQAEAMGSTSVGAIVKMNNAIGDLKENAGELIAKSLRPFVVVIGDLTEGLNNLSPKASGLVGVIGGLTTVFVTLRVTGLLPAIGSIELFGVALTGLKATLIKTGIGALIVALGYGLYELADAYDKFQNRVEGKKASFAGTVGAIREQLMNASEKELEWERKEAEESVEKYKQKIAMLNAQVRSAKRVLKTKDREGNEYVQEYETNESKEIKKEIERIEELKKLAEAKAKIIEELRSGVLRKRVDVYHHKASESMSEADKRMAELREAQRHAEEMMEIEGRNELEMREQKAEHLREQIELYKSYGKDVTELLNRLAEEELRIEKLKERREYKKYDLSDVEMKGVEKPEMKKPKWGDTDEYRRKSEYDEIKLWADKEREKVAIYINADMLRAKIDAEELRRKEEVAEREKEIEEEKEKAKAAMQIETLNYVAAAGNKYTAMSKAVAVFEAYLKAKEAIMTALAAFPPPFNYIAAGAVGAVAAGHVAEIIAMEPPKFEGFAEGGRLRKGEAGIIEGWDNEIIAPEKTFVEVFRNELRPQIYRMEGMRGYNGELTEEVRKLRSELVNGAIKAVAYLDDEQAKKLYIKGSGYKRKVIF